MRTFLAPLMVCVVLFVSACTPGNDVGDSAQQPAATESPIAPTRIPSGSPVPSAPADEPITTANIYGLCIDVSAEFLAPGDPVNVAFAPASEATTVVRDDGYVGIYLEVDDGNNVSSAGSAISCVAGGTVAEPYWYFYGVSSRYADQAEIDASLRVIASA